MKITKWQRFYLDTTLESLDKQFKIVNELLEDIYITHATNREKLIDELSRVILEYKVTAEYMDLTAKEKKKINADIQRTIYDLVAEEEATEKEFIKNTLGDAIKNTYKYQEYILGLGIDFKSLPIAEEVIKQIINNKIAGDIWSNRLWSNKSELEAQLKKDIFNFLKGDISINKIGQNIRAKYETDRYKSQRLVRTELCRVQQEILNKFDEDHDVEYQLFMATLDNKTSKACRDNDGVSFEINDKSKPVPPLHPHCRSALVGIPDKDYRPDTRRNNEDKTIIPYKKYNEWVK